MTTQQEHSESPCIPRERIDFVLFTDGSGRPEATNEGYGGFASVAVSAKYDKILHACGASSHMSVERSELYAVLHGIHVIQHEMNWDSKMSLKTLPLDKPTILVCCDRQSVVGAMNGTYKRRYNLDLWAQYSYLCTLFNIIAASIPRATHPQHIVADMLASESRVLIQSYFDILKQNKTIQ